MTALASIIRAQLATGRPLRVTRALLEALDEADAQLALAKAWGLEAWNDARAAMTHVAQLDALIPCDDYDAPPLRTMVSPERQKVAGWAIATCARVMRGELDAHPKDTRNRLTIDVVWDDERWSLTLARGDYEHAMEAQRNEARSERDDYAERYKVAIESGLTAIAERDEARAEVERLRAALDVERSLECDASAVIREAEERGARWALDRAAQAAGDGVDALRAERICAEARKAGDHG